MIPFACFPIKSYFVSWYLESQSVFSVPIMIGIQDSMVYFICWQVRLVSCMNMFRKIKENIFYCLQYVLLYFPLFYINYQVTKMHGIKQLGKGYQVQFFFCHDIGYRQAFYHETKVMPMAPEERKKKKNKFHHIKHYIIADIFRRLGTRTPSLICGVTEWGESGINCFCFDRNDFTEYEYLEGSKASLHTSLGCIVSQASTKVISAF